MVFCLFFRKTFLVQQEFLPKLLDIAIPPPFFWFPCLCLNKTLVFHLMFLATHFPLYFNRVVEILPWVSPANFLRVRVHYWRFLLLNGAPPLLLRV